MNEEILQNILNAVTGMQADISNMKTDISNMKTDISNMKTDISNMKTDISNMKTDIKNLEDKQEMILNQVIRNLEELATKEDIAAIHRRLDFQLGKIAKTEEEIFLLKSKQ
ncbi:hypothetical protein [Desulfuribacillus alkaliarsenatis]|uniref:Uncharacterized protein n=1 Tax=Desulfuribacillus alkaliarsenatis TaxID=766136 RepID=A0A1E5G2U5_9FIRM|nr:hypothetical protein [Desulfuribacillus alkaliarsenatis]OEF96851.1 hypothetical protein BHF68_07265 [Desulfuribacillus alkaliarsenatis]